MVAYAAGDAVRVDNDLVPRGVHQPAEGQLDGSLGADEVHQLGLETAAADLAAGKDKHLEEGSEHVDELFAQRP